MHLTRGFSSPNSTGVDERPCFPDLVHASLLNTVTHGAGAYYLYFIMGGYACTCWRGLSGAVVNIEIKINEQAALTGGTSAREAGAEMKFDPAQPLRRTWCPHEDAPHTGPQGSLTIHEFTD